MSDNYNAVRERWRLRFLEMDHESLAERFHLKIDEDYLYLCCTFPGVASAGS